MYGQNCNAVQSIKRNSSVRIKLLDYEAVCDSVNERYGRIVDIMKYVKRSSPSCEAFRRDTHMWARKIMTGYLPNRTSR